MFLVAMVSVFGAKSSSFMFSDLDFTMSKCKNMTGEERKMCQSEFVLEAQLRLDETRVRLDEKRLQYEKTLAFSRDYRENIAFVHNLQKDEAAARSLKFPGLTVDPQDTKSLMVALITFASLTAVVILNAARIRSNRCASSVPSYRSCSQHRTD
jgi:hypothetical protein